MEDWDVHWTERTTNNAFEVDYFRQSHNPQKARVAWREKGSCTDGLSHKCSNNSGGVVVCLDSLRCGLF